MGGLQQLLNSKNSSSSEKRNKEILILHMNVHLVQAYKPPLGRVTTVVIHAQVVGHADPIG